VSESPFFQLLADKLSGWESYYLSRERMGSAFSDWVNQGNTCQRTQFLDWREKATLLSQVMQR
jgi:hypothetical protein